MGESPTEPPESATRYIETSRGALSYAELASLLADQVAAAEERIADDGYASFALDEELIRALHHDIAAELVPSIGGRWRQCDVRVGSHEPPPYPRVRELMREYARDLAARIAGDLQTEQNLLETLAFAEGRLLSIHPFEDFNGRVTRVFLSELLRRLELPALEPTPDTGLPTQRYLEALSAADRHEWTPLMTIWRERFNRYEAEQFFDERFEPLTGSDTPFPWQRKLFIEFAETRGPQFRPVCPVPTGLGKTSVLAIWLLALAWHQQRGTGVTFPRRLAYVVNRRTVVDQATTEARQLRSALLEKSALADVRRALQALASEADEPLAISTLRGEFADNAEWRHDPARPAIVVGTVDMIGSRLLFSGYGCGFKSKPLHAGLLGQDTLLVHDEAHLEPAFQKLLEAIVLEQKRCSGSTNAADWRGFHTMALSATSRSGEEPAADRLFGGEDYAHGEAGRRLGAWKWLSFRPVADAKKLAKAAGDLALTKMYRDSGKAILIYLRSVEDVFTVATRLGKEGLSVCSLTGTLRGLERDALTQDNDVFARFLPPKKDQKVLPKEGTVYLVCTSAGEVGVNISADHLICDATPMDSMAQRFGRVNRFGTGEARIEILHPPVTGKTSPETAKADEAPALGDADSLEPSQPPTEVAGEAEGTGKKKQPTAYDLACQHSLRLLKTLPMDRNKSESASPAALSKLIAGLSEDDRESAFTPTPAILPVTDILFDAWALTTVRGKLPGRPLVGQWLHGIQSWEPPETHVAWREEVSALTGPLLDAHAPDDVLDDYPLKPHERLRDRTRRVFDHLTAIAKRIPESPVWLSDAEGTVQVMTMAKLTTLDAKGNPRVNIGDGTVILPPTAGGFKDGFLDGSSAFNEGTDYDVSESWRDDKGQPRRCRVWDDAIKPAGMRLVRRIVLPQTEDDDADEDVQPRTWSWYARPRAADDDGSFSARIAQALDIHHRWTEFCAAAIAVRLGLDRSHLKLAKAVVLAARWHDLGKNRRVWQRSIGNPDPETNILAKSGLGMKPTVLTRYRHEFGSLLDVKFNDDLDSDSQQLVLHLIAAHHGRARPHFPDDEAFDPEHCREIVADTARAVPQRFARLQRRYGRWGLAWLESLVRAADAMASQAIK